MPNSAQMSHAFNPPPIFSWRVYRLRSKRPPLATILRIALGTALVVWILIWPALLALNGIGAVPASILIKPTGYFVPILIAAIWGLPFLLASEYPPSWYRDLTGIDEVLLFDDHCMLRRPSGMFERVDYEKVETITRVGRGFTGEGSYGVMTLELVAEGKLYRTSERWVSDKDSIRKVEYILISRCTNAVVLPYKDKVRSSSDDAVWD